MLVRNLIHCSSGAFTDTTTPAGTTLAPSLAKATAGIGNSPKWQCDRLVWAFFGGLLGYTMVSNRLRYVHIASRLLTRRTFDAFAYVIFGIILVAVIPEIILPLLFIGYLFSAPVVFVFDKLHLRKTQKVDSSEQSSEGV